METGSENLKEEYHGYIFRKILFIVLCILAIIVAAGIGCTIGDRDIAFTEVYRIIFDHLNGATYGKGTSEWWDDFVVWELRLPRIIMAIVAGCGLAIGGIAMQSMLNNPLADPYTTGISSGVCFGAISAMVVGFSYSSILGQYGIVTNAFLFGLIPAAIIILLSRFVDASPATMILAGIAVSYIFNSFNTLIMITSEAETLKTVYVWQIGSLSRAVWSDLPTMFLVTAIGSAFVVLTARQLNLLMLGEKSAISLGLDAGTYRIVCLAILSVSTAGIVSYTGIIGFVGLVSPHIVRMVIGADNRYVAPAAMAFGSALLLFADIIGRTIVQPSELPVGVILSFIGAPIFLIIIMRQKKGYGGDLY